MSDLQSPSSPPLTSAPMPGAVSPGALLRQARQAQGLHIETVAASLKVTVAKLEALEADQFQVFPDANFVRAFAGSVCRTLKIDAAPILAALPPGALHRLSPNSEGINTRLRDERSRGLLTLLGGKPIALAVFALLVGAVLLFFMPQPSETEPDAETPAEEASLAVDAEPPAVTTTAPAPTDAAVPVPVAPPSIAVPAAPATLPVVPPATSVPLSPPVPAPAPLSSPPPPSPAAAVPAASVNTAEVLVLSARASSWIHIRDGKGTTVLQRTLGTGERLVVSQAPPLSVTVGRADMTDVTVRGVPFNTAALSQSNVARFEVK